MYQLGRRRLGLVLSTWHIGARRSRSRQLLLSRSVRRLQTALVCAALNRWRDMARKQQLVVRAVSRLSERNLSMAFDHWLEALYQARELRSHDQYMDNVEQWRARVTQAEAAVESLRYLVSDQGVLQYHFRNLLHFRLKKVNWRDLHKHVNFWYRRLL